MKRLLIALAVISFFAGCKQNKKEGQTNSISDIKNASQKLTVRDSVEVISIGILTALKNQNYSAFASFFHPTEGVRFSPYGFIDPMHKTVVAKDFLEAIEKNWTLTWGHFDGSGEAIKIKVKPYLSRFVYNADYLQADDKRFDDFIAQGNTINNLKESYPGLHFMEYYFNGRDEKMKGLDWTSLKLVFKKYENIYYLVAVVHDQWTI